MEGRSVEYETKNSEQKKDIEITEINNTLYSEHEINETSGEIEVQQSKFYLIFPMHRKYKLFFYGI